ncbi:MAG: MlaD family protein [Actinomycetota bacterium]
MVVNRRLVKVIATAAIATVTAASLGSCASSQAAQKSAYCALMPDTVGLYVGNPVTEMGFKVGQVTSITPGNTSVRVDFTLDESRKPTEDAKAVIRSTSLLADRSLELVGNPEGGPSLRPGACIPLERAFTPKTLSEVIGSTATLLKAISPEGSTNVADTVRGLDQALSNTGPRANQLLTTTSAVLDSPDQTVAAIGEVIRNLSQLTGLVRELSGPIKQILYDLQKIMPDIIRVVKPVGAQLFGTTYLFKAAADIEVTLGETLLQPTLDSTSVMLRKLSAHAPRLANLLNPIPWWINTVANHYNSNRPFNTLGYRPPLYRIRTPNGVALCNIMNASAPGSCANVQGTPYAVDVALLQYVLTQAAR